jgi:hypothetical protein
MKRSRKIAVKVSVVAVLAVCGLAAIALAAGGSNQREAAQLLRLNDLPLGYLGVELLEEHGNVPECEPLTEPEDTPPRMLAFVRRYHPRGCIFGYQLLFGEPGGAPGPLLVGTGILDAKSMAEAKAGWAVIAEMLGRVVGDQTPVPAKTAAKVGAATRLFHTHVKLFPGSGEKPVSFLVWRSGKTLAAVMTTGRSFEVDDAAAALYARRQQVHIAEPTRYKNAERYEGEVPLENPAIDLPVYWLGRNFHPAGLPAVRLADSFFNPEPLAEREEKAPYGDEVFYEGPVPPLHLRYGVDISFDGEGVDLSTWGPADWHLYSESRTGRAIVKWKCTTTKTLAVSGGTATIYAGYKRNFAKCPKKAPEAFTAWVRFGEDTIVVDAPFAADFIETGGPYRSLAGMEAIVGALRLRTPPVR